VKPVPLSPSFSAASQIRPEEIPAVVAAGFRWVVNNRPDGEGQDQPSSHSIEIAVRRAGLDYEHIPVTPDQLTPDQAQRLQAFMERVGGPVLGFCGSGRRAAQLWALSQARLGADADDVLATAASAGYDLSALRTRLVEIAG
jgi:sulfide:quinone oxidoreductase